MKGMSEFRNGITCSLIAPILGLNIFENVKIEINAGTAQGKSSITPKKRFPLINDWFITIAVKIPIINCKVVAITVQITVQDKTETKVSR